MSRLLFALSVFAILQVTILLVYRKRRRQRLPPGPRPHFLLGNLFDLPLQNEADGYHRLAQAHGPLTFMSILGKNILVVNTFEAAMDLFEKRSANYSDRNTLPMIGDLMGWNWSFGFMPYGEKWKQHRRMFRRQFRSETVPSYRPILTKFTHRFLQQQLDQPHALTENLRLNVGSMIVEITYGLKTTGAEDPYICTAEKALEGMATASKPGAFWVDLIPWLKYVPDRLCITDFKQQAHTWRKAVMEMRDEPFDAVRYAMQQGLAPPSFVSNLLIELDVTKMTPQEAEVELDTIRACAGMTYAAGTEGTVASLTSFFLAMLLYPEVQANAQRELDAVVGHDRLPEFGDRESLPYLDAVLKELLRWNPIAPLGLPHMATNEDVYKGYSIPAGTSVIGNTWTILHDPKTFPNPENFDPPRFLSSNDSAEIMERLDMAFGYGRRRCPGRFMAESQLWIMIASVLSSFNILPARDERGELEIPKAEFVSGMIRHPIPFRYSIVPRHEGVKELVEHAMERHGEQDL